MARAGQGTQLGRSNQRYADTGDGLIAGKGVSEMLTMFRRFPKEIAGVVRETLSDAGERIVKQASGRVGIRATEDTGALKRAHFWRVRALQNSVPTLSVGWSVGRLRRSIWRGRRFDYGAYHHDGSPSTTGRFRRGGSRKWLKKLFDRENENFARVIGQRIRRMLEGLAPKRRAYFQAKTGRPR